VHAAEQSRTATTLTANATTSSLQYGIHILYAFATDGSDATSIAHGSSPVIGAVNAYLFLFAPPIVTQHISAISRSGNDILITFDAVAGNRYRLERKSDISDPNATWQSIVGLADVMATSSSAQVTDPNALSLGKAFYRVRLLP
jgi:hypothetical protein